MLGIPGVLWKSVENAGHGPKDDQPENDGFPMPHGALPFFSPSIIAQSDGSRILRKSGTRNPGHDAFLLKSDRVPRISHMSPFF